MPGEQPDLLRFEGVDQILDLSASQPLMLLKHSTRCPVSAFAYREFERYASSASTRGVQCGLVLVVEERPLSAAVADSLGIPHHSPQAILIKDGEAVWSDSHRGVNAEALKQAEKDLST